MRIEDLFRPRIVEYYPEPPQPAPSGPSLGEWRVRINPHNGDCYCERYSAVSIYFNDWDSKHTAKSEAEALDWIDKEQNGWRIVPAHILSPLKEEARQP